MFNDDIFKPKFLHREGAPVGTATAKVNGKLFVDHMAEPDNSPEAMQRRATARQEYHQRLTGLRDQGMAAWQARQPTQEQVGQLREMREQQVAARTRQTNPNAVMPVRQQQPSIQTRMQDRIAAIRDRFKRGV